MLGDYEITDARFRDIILSNAKVERLAADCRWVEGPLWWADAGQLLWSDIPNDRILRWTEGAEASVYRQPADYSNGRTRDRQGRLITCEHGTRSVTRTEVDGSRTVLADSHDDGRLNSPNDVVVRSDDSVWFTDPPYGILSDYEGHAADTEQAGSFVFRLDPTTGALRVVADDFVKPNGLAFSPDEQRLYITDSGRSHDPAGPSHVRVFRVSDDGELSGGDVFADIDPPLADGLTVDTQGRVWASAGDGVHCFAPDGARLGRIRVPEVVANLTFGGPKRNRLFITGTTSLYAVYVNATGAQSP